jgi:Na+-transporting methylmalonyl-CoA/oxaloacetate decarboxylase gamma subunit
VADTLKSAIILSIVDMAAVFAVLIILFGILKLLSLFSREKTAPEDQVQKSPMVDKQKVVSSDLKYNDDDNDNALEKYITVEYEDGSVKKIYFKEVE